MSKFFSYFLILFVNLILITFIVFFFSYISLINGKTYDLFWINSIQKKLYFEAGLRNIWQSQKKCSEFDEHLLYKPKDGICIFENPEYSTKIIFKNGVRSNGQDLTYVDTKKSIYFLGDSLAMGWGVNDEDTYISKLEKLIKKKTYNLAVPSYGTVRQIKKLNTFKNLANLDIIFIHYSFDDFFENSNLDISKKYQFKDFEKLTLDNFNNQSKIFFLLRYYKKSFRIFYHDLIKLFKPEKYLINLDLEEHFNLAQKIIKNNFKGKNKIIFLFTISPDMKITNYPKESNLFSYLILNLNKNFYFKVDDHLNKDGHAFIANALVNYLNSN